MILTDNIPYEALGADLFESSVQKRIPFLGAGVSTSAIPASEAPATPIQDPRISQALAVLEEQPDSAAVKFSPESLFFIRSAMHMAMEYDRSNRQRTGGQLFTELKERAFPPSAGELIELFRTFANLPPFEAVTESVIKRLGYGENQKELTAQVLVRLAALTSVSAPSLSGMSAYFEHVTSRTDLLKRVADIVGNKTHSTPTHKLIARAAALHLKRNKGHFLIITTNYDCLMEEALNAEPDHPGYVVLSARRDNFLVQARFGNMADELRARFEKANAPRTPNLCTLEMPEPVGSEIEPPYKHLIVLYKLHGCIHEVLQCPRIREDPLDDSQDCPHDGIVLSEDDYIASIARLAHNDGIIPATVVDLMLRKPILFLGYSLNDWNVRGFLQVLRKKTGEDRDKDYAVIRRLTRLDEGFFDKNKITVLKTDLNEFSRKLERLLGENGVH